jgi:hypothetical protein
VSLADPEAFDRALFELAGPDAVTLAEIWATVDTDRALVELHARVGSPAANDELLGARVSVVAATPARPVLAVVEPITEGRLAATLARHGEGSVGRYVEVADGLAPARRRAAVAGIGVSRVAEGPFGPSMLVLLGPVTGPHLILCDPAVPSTP